MNLVCFLVKILLCVPIICLLCLLRTVFVGPAYIWMVGSSLKEKAHNMSNGGQWSSLKFEQPIPGKSSVGRKFRSQF